MTTPIEKGGGTEKYFIESSRQLSQLFDVQVNIVTMDKKFLKKISPLMSLYYFRNLGRGSSRKESIAEIKNKLGKVRYRRCHSLKELAQVLKNYDTIYSKNELLEAFILKFFIGYKHLPPVIFGCHTPIYYPKAHTFHSLIHNALYNGFIFKYLTREVKTFHVINSPDEKRIKKLFPDRQIVKIYNPFDFNGFEQKAINYKYSHIFDQTKINILWVGRLTEQKGVNELTILVNEVNNSGYKNRIVWNIVGDGEDKAKIEQLAKEWNNINYFGYVENNYLASIYQNNNLLICTSQWEGFPYSLLEAQSLGLPVVAYDISGCNEIIENGKNGFLVNTIDEFEKKVLFFLDGKRLDTNIKEFIRSKFNENMIYNQLAHLFNSL